MIGVFGFSKEAFAQQCFASKLPIKLQSLSGTISWKSFWENLDLLHGEMPVFEVDAFGVIFTHQGKSNPCRDPLAATPRGWRWWGAERVFASTIFPTLAGAGPPSKTRLPSAWINFFGREEPESWQVQKPPRLPARGGLIQSCTVRHRNSHLCP